eukprot:1527688-Pyramimonas_sp.AAC.1
MCIRDRVIDIEGSDDHGEEQGEEDEEEESDPEDSSSSTSSSTTGSSASSTSGEKEDDDGSADSGDDADPPFVYREDGLGNKYYRYVSLYKTFHKISGEFTGWQAHCRRAGHNANGKCTKNQTAKSDGGAEGVQRRLLHWACMGGGCANKPQHKDKWEQVVDDWNNDLIGELAELEVAACDP